MIYPHSSFPAAGVQRRAPPSECCTNQLLERAYENATVLAAHLVSTRKTFLWTMHCKGALWLLDSWSNGSSLLNFSKLRALWVVEQKEKRPEPSLAPEEMPLCCNSMRTSPWLLRRVNLREKPFNGPFSFALFANIQVVKLSAMLSMVLYRKNHEVNFSWI